MDYSEKKIVELTFIYLQRGIKNYRKMSKNKMIEILKANDEDPNLN